jgi:hypothetical protein
MRTVGIWVSSLLASTIPFIFVGAVLAFGACVFDAEGEHALTSRFGPSFQAEAATPKRVLVADADAHAREVSTFTTPVAITRRARRANPVSTPT